MYGARHAIFTPAMNFIHTPLHITSAGIQLCPESPESLTLSSHSSIVQCLFFLSLLGYVLDCFPSASEAWRGLEEQLQLVSDLDLSPDVIINLKVSMQQSHAAGNQPRTRTPLGRSLGTRLAANNMECCKSLTELTPAVLEGIRWIVCSGCHCIHGFLLSHVVVYSLDTFCMRKIRVCYTGLYN